MYNIVLYIETWWEIPVCIYTLYSLLLTIFISETDVSKMENEEKLLKCAVKKLENMNQLSVDSRPKTLIKLKNALENEKKVIYVRDCLKHLLKMDFHKISTGKKLLKIYRKDTELDREIVVYLTDVASKSARHLFVLPCDSPLHTKVLKNVKVNNN